VQKSERLLVDLDAIPHLMTVEPYADVRFYPVLHLLTGPPGLARNGGIWRKLKEGLRGASRPLRLMVQALHFVSYDLSQSAWKEWFPRGSESSRLARELAESYGPRRDVFVDSGGFQLLHAEKIDLSRWGLSLNAASIFRLQTLYDPQKIASLDSPIPPSADAETASRLARISIRNAVWLAENVSTANKRPQPYLVAHGRTPIEVRAYLDKLEQRLPRGWLRNHDYGLALGSQVPLSGNPELVQLNIEALLDWMDRSTPKEVEAHIFGVGDAIMGAVVRRHRDGVRPLSYDNSTYVQKAFRLRIFDPARRVYLDLDPTNMPDCDCRACDELSQLGKQGLANVLSSPAYSKSTIAEQAWYKSDVLALAALHNLRWWRTRLGTVPPHRRTNLRKENANARQKQGEGYRFPLPRFKPVSPSLLLLPCSKWRPYGESAQHVRVKNLLATKSLVEGRDFDRITLSGLYGPVHWSDEQHPAILGYDFPLTAAVSEDHVRWLTVQTATVLGVISRRYHSIVAVLKPGQYHRVFGPVTTAFKGTVVRDPSEAIKAMNDAS
jgi:7-cyano-7-deazaguanine tRNA-ribosyltransferase